MAAAAIFGAGSPALANSPGPTDAEYIKHARAFLVYLCTRGTAGVNPVTIKSSTVSYRKQDGEKAEGIVHFRGRVDLNEPVGGLCREFAEKGDVHVYIELRRVKGVWQL